MKSSVAIIALLVAGAAHAQSGPRLPPGPVDAYRVDSQYGASEAVLKPRFGRDGKLEVGIGGAYSNFSSLVDYYAYTGSLTYHINMRHAIEPIWFGYVKGTQGAFVKNEITEKVGKLGTSGVEIPEQIFAASYLFSPFYTKMHITEQSVTHFDVYFGLGFGMLRNREVFLNGKEGDLINRPAASLAAGVRFLFPERWGMRVELRDFVHSMKNFNASSIGSTMQVAASVDIFFGSFKGSGD